VAEKVALCDISLEELEAERRDTVVDIALCKAALWTFDVTNGDHDCDYNTLQDRLDANERILSIINDELARRQ